MELRILVVEDDPAQAAVMVKALRHDRTSPISVVAVARLDHALARLSSDEFDAVVLDLILPDSEGLPTFLRVARAVPHIPIVILTSWNHEAAAAATLREGAQEYLVQGEADMRSLSTVVRHAIARHEYREVRDATERHVRRESLRPSEVQYRFLVEGAVQGILIHLNGVIRFANPALADLVGAGDANDLVGQSMWQYIFPEDRPLVAQYAQARLAGGPAPTRYELRIVRQDGSVRWVDCVVNVIPWDGELTGMAALVDITDRKETEERLRASEERFRQTEEQLLQVLKMEAVGQLAGGIAHDFNNLLMAMGKYADQIAEDLGPLHRSRPHVEGIQTALQSGKRLTRQLFAFSRRQILEPQLLDLNQALGRVELLLQRVIGPHIALVVNLTTPLAHVLADPGQVEQIIMNLAVNARDALPDGGRLTIHTANVELDDVYVAHHPGASVGSHVMIAVSDDGVGMDQATRQRLFEPFFTTKPAGRGTGLGLSTVYGIVKQNGGSISVSSEPGEGSTFRIYLPAATAPVDQETVDFLEDHETVDFLQDPDGSEPPDSGSDDPC